MMHRTWRRGHPAAAMLRAFAFDQNSGLPPLLPLWVRRMWLKPNSEFDVPAFDLPANRRSHVLGCDGDAPVPRY